MAVPLTPPTHTPHPAYFIIDLSTLLLRRARRLVSVRGFCNPAFIMSTNTTSSWVPNDNLTSAYVGEPPNTQRDWYIVRGFLRTIGMGDVDPAKGYIVAATAADTGQDYTSKRPAVIAGLIIILVAITTVTGSRIALRASMSQMRFGADDWATIAAAVCFFTSSHYPKIQAGWFLVCDPDTDFFLARIGAGPDLYHMSAHYGNQGWW